MEQMVYKFGLIGAAGYVAPRHMKAIRDTGHILASALDPYDGIGILDQYFPEASFFTNFERFDRHMDLLRREGTPVDYLSICSPNYLHDAHIRYGLRNGMHVICEKPLVLNPWNAKALLELEQEGQYRVSNILQLRLHPAIQKLKADLASQTSKAKIQLHYITPRGKWYHYSWKGDPEKSGGIATNIGIHFFDMLIWIFGPMESVKLQYVDHQTAIGQLQLAHAEVFWTLSIDAKNLPTDEHRAKNQAYRSLIIDGQSVDFSEGFTDLHTESYRHIFETGGFRISDVLPAIHLVTEIRKMS